MKKADECAYWKTSSSSPGTWSERTRGLIEKNGGEVIGNGTMKKGGVECFVMSFDFGEDRFSACWPVLDHKYKGDEVAARRQAATMLYHDVKNRVVAMQVFGARIAFLGWLSLPDGSTVQDCVDRVVLALPGKTAGGPAPMLEER